MKKILIGAILFLPVFGVSAMSQAQFTYINVSSIKDTTAHLSLTRGGDDIYSKNNIRFEYYPATSGSSCENNPACITTDAGVKDLDIKNLTPNTKYNINYAYHNEIYCVTTPCPQGPVVRGGHTNFTTAALGSVSLPNPGEEKIVDMAKPDQTPQFIKNTLRMGSRGVEVTHLQNVLYSKGYLDQTNVTGYFGTKTMRALKKFQKDNNLAQTGTLGPKTRILINQELNKNTIVN